jgi:hypothetical protein
LRELEATQGERTSEIVKDLGRALIQLGALGEAMAVWWEAELLREMALNSGEYLRDKQVDNPLIGLLEAEGRESCLEHIRHWDRAAYHPEPFSRTFAGSFLNMEMDRWGFLGVWELGEKIHRLRR